MINNMENDHICSEAINLIFFITTSTYSSDEGIAGFHNETSPISIDVRFSCKKMEVEHLHLSHESNMEMVTAGITAGLTCYNMSHDREMNCLLAFLWSVPKQSEQKQLWRTWQLTSSHPNTLQWRANTCLLRCIIGQHDSISIFEHTKTHHLLPRQIPTQPLPAEPVLWRPEGGTFSMSYTLSVILIPQGIINVHEDLLMH